MKIKLPSQTCHDRVMWHYDRCRDYTVKSGCHIVRKWKNLTGVTSSNGSTRQLEDYLEANCSFQA